MLWDKRVLLQRDVFDHCVIQTPRFKMVLSDYVTSVVLTAVIALVTVKVIQIIFSTWTFNRKFKNLPQTPSHPILGHMYKFPGLGEAGLAKEVETMRAHPRFHVFWFFFEPSLDVTHPDLVKIILKSSEPKDPDLYQNLHPWLGKGLLTSNGHRWARSRRLLTPAFHYDILKGYIQMKNDLCNDLLDKFEYSSKSGESLNVFECISMFTLDVILQSSMSYETGCQKAGNNHPYIVAVAQIMSRIVTKSLTWYYQWDSLYHMTPEGRRFLKDCKFVHDIADDIISKRRIELENKSGSTKRKRQDFLDTLITARDEEGNGLTSKEIRDEVDTFLFEGHDTTSSAISWCLYALANDQGVFKRVQKEVDGLLEGRDNDYILWEDLPKMPYLTMALKESMRLHTPVPNIARQLTKDTKLDEYTIPAGTTIGISPYNIHHNPAVWEDPMKYDPERFTPENIEKRDPFAFVPFSAGPRNCIGQNFAMEEMKIALARMVHRYDFTLDPNHKVVHLERLVMKAENDIKLVVKSR